MKSSLHPRCIIQENARIIQELHRRNHEASRKRNDGPDAAKAHSKACHEFHSAYDGLAFPGGWNAALKRLKACEAHDAETALAFLEVRPYFFRSQCIWKKLSRLLSHVPLTKVQAERLRQIRVEERLRNEARRASC